MKDLLLKLDAHSRLLLATVIAFIVFLLTIGHLQMPVQAIIVWNAGPRIAESERDRIFERFYRGTEARRTAPGSGLGLYVARKIARAHGGDLTLLDGTLDEVGFRLTLPFSTHEAPDAEREL